MVFYLTCVWEVSSPKPLKHNVIKINRCFDVNFVKKTNKVNLSFTYTLLIFSKGHWPDLSIKKNIESMNGTTWMLSKAAEMLPERWRYFYPKLCPIAQKPNDGDSLPNFLFFLVFGPFNLLWTPVMNDGDGSISQSEVKVRVQSV